jgi:hypothetical protein
MIDIKYVFLFMMLFTLAGSSCERSSDKDYSFSPEEYQRMGLPDHLKIWDYNDYTEACVVLNNIKANKPLSLPKKDSKRSGVVFNRMIDPENLVFLQDEALSLKDKAYQIQKYIDIQGCFVTAYTDLNTSEQYYNRELIDLYIFGLTIAQDMLDLGRLINESVVEEDIEMQSRYPSIKNMYLTMVEFVLMNQQKSHFFETEDLERLSDFLYNSLLINREWINEDAAKEIKRQVKKVLEATSSDKIHQKYSSLIDIL